MKLHLLENRNLGGYATFGTCWKRGEVKEACFCLKNSAGKPIPVQSEAAAYWPDGSVKWARHTADSRLMGEEVTVEKGKSAKAPGLTVTKRNGGFLIDAGRISIEIPAPGTKVLAQNLHSLRLITRLLLPKAI